MIPESPQDSPTGTTDDLAPLPRPFDAEPKQVKTDGCGRYALIGCGAAVLLFGLACGIFVTKANDMLVWLLEKLETQIVTALPDDLSQAERARLDAAWDDLFAAIEADEFDPIALQALQAELMNAAQGAADGLTREQVLELIDALESTAGTAESDAPPPDPEPDDPPPAEDSAAGETA